MAVQAGILNAQIPMSSEVKAPDIVGSYVRGVEARGKLQTLATEEQDRDLAAQDQAAVKSYLASGGDFHTPPGVEKAVNDLKGSVSSGAYMKLAAYADKMKTDDFKAREGMIKLTGDQLNLRQMQLDKGVVYMAQPLSVYEKALPGKGEQGAAADFEEAKAGILTAAAAEKLSDGAPAFPPEILERIKAAGPTQLKALLSQTKYQKDMTAEMLARSQITRNEGLAKFDEARAAAVEKTGMPGGGGGSLSEIGKIERDVASGLISREQGTSMINGIVSKKSKSSDTSSLTEDATERAANDYYMNRTLPARLNAFERSQIMNRAAEIATGAGDNAEAGTIRAEANKANRAALAQVTKQEQLTGVFERDAEKRLGLVLELAKKADTSGSPALNRWIRAGRANILGDPDVNNLNSAMISLQAELAKVLSGALGNAGVSDAARAEAAQIINANMSMEQLDSLAPNIRKELKFKLDSFKEQKQTLIDAMKTPGGGPALRTPGAAAPESTTNPGEPARGFGSTEAEKDRNNILLSEYRAVQKKLTETTDPEQKARFEGDLRALGREMQAAGVKAVVPPSAAPATRTGAPPPKNAKGWTLLRDAKGNMAYVGPNNEIEEVK